MLPAKSKPNTVSAIVCVDCMRTTTTFPNVIWKVCLLVSRTKWIYFAHTQSILWIKRMNSYKFHLETFTQIICTLFLERKKQEFHDRTFFFFKFLERINSLCAFEWISNTADFKLIMQHHFLLEEKLSPQCSNFSISRFVIE